MSQACAQDTSVWRALLASKVGLVVVVTFFGVALAPTSAESQDITPPTLTAFSFTPTTIDTRSGQAVVTVSVSATDDLSGVDTVFVSFLSPSGRQSRGAFGLPFSPATRACLQTLTLQPQESGCDQPHRTIICCTFLITRRHPTVLLQPIDQPLHLLAQPVERSIKRAASLCIDLVGDGDPDAMRPQIRSDFATALSLVPHHAPRTSLRTPSAAAFHCSPGH
jgi:hypothetical protein